jgi:iron complex outermembrane recepter protein
MLFPSTALHAQATGSIDGTILDGQGKGVVNAAISVKNGATEASKTTKTNANGYYSVDGLPAGTYTVNVTASGFATSSKTGVSLAPGETQHAAFTLNISSVAEQITVNAGIDSIAAQTAPSGGFIEERSAQSLISNTYIENFTSPIADFGEIVQIVPGAFTISSDGVGLGQSKTTFRGFPDGDFDIDFDGIPFYDTNSPTHHSWAFFPAQWIGGVDFDRSPGTASTIGPTPFGGSIHLLSKPLTSEQDVRGTVSYGTWNTKLYEGSYNSGNFGLFGSPKKSNLFADVHHMSSDGYQTFNYNTRNAGSLLYQYQFSPKTVLTGFSGVIQLNANTYGLNPTRCQTIASTPSSLCSATTTINNVAYNTAPNGIQPYTGYGYKFEMVNNSNPANWLDYQYNHYQVPTDFEYVGIKTEYAHGWYLDVKGYTYNYDNGELFTNAQPITEVTQAAGIANPTLVPGSMLAGTGSSAVLYYNGVAVAPCDVAITGKTSKTTGLAITALPCAVDKYNSYRKYGETAVLSQTSHFGIFRAGMWYEWARTNRHQYPSDPLNNWTDQPLPNFNEEFWTNSYQPYAEYEFHPTPKLNITAGTKFAAYTFDVLHHADNGKTVGELSCYPNTTAACSATVTDTGSFTAWLPSLDFNYRLHPNWSVYLQGSTGSIVPPSSVYDYSHTPTTVNPTPGLQTPPKQQKSTTYQAGTVMKLQRFTLDADVYHIRFDNSYSSLIDPTTSETVNYLQPSSVTQGVEFETTAVLARGLNLYLNATAANAYYAGELNAGSATAPYYEKAPSGLWVQETPADTEMQGLTYQRYGLDLGFFNKRVGEQRVDNGAYHNQGIIAPFSTLDTYLNYSIRNRSIFDGTKIRLDATNLLDSHNTTALALTGTAQTELIGGGSCANATASDPCDVFNTTGPTPINGNDQPTFIAGRSFSVTVTFGLAPRERK